MLIPRHGSMPHPRTIMALPIHQRCNADFPPRHNISPLFPHQTQLGLSSQARRIEHEHEHDGCRLPADPICRQCPCLLRPASADSARISCGYPLSGPEPPIRQSSLSHLTGRQSTFRRHAIPPLLFLSRPYSHVGGGCLFDLTAEISPPKSLERPCLDRPSSSTPGRGRDGRSSQGSVRYRWCIPSTRHRGSPGSNWPIGCLSVHHSHVPRPNSPTAFLPCTRHHPLSTLWSMSLPFGIPRSSPDPYFRPAKQVGSHTGSRSSLFLDVTMVLLCHRPQ